GNDFITSVISITRGCSPPMDPRVARERMNTFGFVYHSLIRMRSPSTAPRLNGEEGSTQSTPTLFPLEQNSLIIASTNVLLPAPGGPVTPMILDDGGGSDFNNCSYPSNSFSMRDIVLASDLVSPSLTAFNNSCHMNVD